MFIRASRTRHICLAMNHIVGWNRVLVIILNIHELNFFRFVRILLRNFRKNALSASNFFAAAPLMHSPYDWQLFLIKTKGLHSIVEMPNNQLLKCQKKKKSFIFLLHSPNRICSLSTETTAPFIICATHHLSLWRYFNIQHCWMFKLQTSVSFSPSA